MHPATLTAAVKALLDAHPVAIARAIHEQSDGLDSAQANVSKFASVVQTLATLVCSDRTADADSRLKAMEYGEALHDRLMARAASEYSTAIEAAHEASAEAEGDAESLGEDHEHGPANEPTTAEAFAKACRFYGV